MVRIRYKKVDGLLKSGELLGKDAIHEVHLSPETLSATIFSNKNNLLKSVSAKTLPSLKKAVKTELLALGVAFSPEVRPRLKKEVPNESNSNGTN